MNIVDSGILGAVQGLTEFLPISSSGHLVLAQSFIPGFKQPGVLFDVVLHFGTLFAVLWYFWKKLLRISVEEVTLLIIGTIPAVVIGFLFQSQIEALFSSVKLVALALIITGIMNLLTDKAVAEKKAVSKIDSLKIGIAQAFAIIPGISRSGSTIFAGAKLGIEKARAAEFSFLLSVLAVLGANILQIIKHGFNGGFDIPSYLTGLAASFIVGLLSIKLVFRFLTEKKFKIFGIYCIFLGVIFLIF